MCPTVRSSLGMGIFSIRTRKAWAQSIHGAEPQLLRFVGVETSHHLRLDPRFMSMLAEITWLLSERWRLFIQRIFDAKSSTSSSSLGPQWNSLYTDAEKEIFAFFSSILFSVLNTDIAIFSSEHRYCYFSLLRQLSSTADLIMDIEGSEIWWSLLLQR